MDINARGYVSHGETKTSKGGASYNQFTLGVKQKEKAWGDKPEKITWVNLRVTDMSGGSLPADKAYATIDGRLTVREYEKDGAKRTSLEVFTKSVEVAPPFGSDTGATTNSPKSTKEVDPWDA